MDKYLTIKFEHLNLKSIEGQLLMAACVMQTGSMDSDGMNDYIIELREVHDEMLFTKELNKMIGK